MKKNNKHKSGPKHEYKKVIVEDHAIERYIQRTGNYHLSRQKVIKKIIYEVLHSKLIDIEGNIEHKSFYGNIYVLKTTYSKDAMGLIKSVVYVKTVKISSARMKERFSENFDMKNVDWKAIGISA
jgi:hypothetical protein